MLRYSYQLANRLAVFDDGSRAAAVVEVVGVERDPIFAANDKAYASGLVRIGFHFPGRIFMSASAAFERT